MACESFVENLMGFLILLKTDVVGKIFPNLNVVCHLVVPAGWDSCLARLAIFIQCHLCKYLVFCGNLQVPCLCDPTSFLFIFTEFLY